MTTEFTTSTWRLPGCDDLMVTVAIKGAERPTWIEFRFNAVTRHGTVWDSTPYFPVSDVTAAGDAALEVERGHQSTHYPRREAA